MISSARNGDATQQQVTSKRRRPVLNFAFSKKLRSRVLCRKRVALTGIVDGRSNQASGSVAVMDFSASSSSSCFPSEISCNSTMFSAEFCNLHKRSGTHCEGIENDVIIGNEPEDSRIMTRSYYRKRRKAILENNEINRACGVNLSESSCAESFHRFNELNFSQVVGSSEVRSTMRESSCEVTEIREETQQSVIPVTVPPSVLNIASYICEGDRYSESSSKMCSNSHEVAYLDEIAGSEGERLETSCLHSVSDVKISRHSSYSGKSNGFQSTTEKSTGNILDYVSDFACSEKLSDCDQSDYVTSEEVAFSDLEKEIFPSSPLGETLQSEYMRSSLTFADVSKISSNQSVPSACFSSFLHYSQQFVRSAYDSKVAADDFSQEFVLLRFEDAELEESYRIFRSWERKQVVPYDYFVDDGGFMHPHVDMVVQQRLLMVNWMVEHATVNGLQWETLFLSVGLLDRCLSMGSFDSKRMLQLLGVSCCTLATRIEEKQPLNCIRQSTFCVYDNTYSRYEVVGMEWLVQEVLSFRCLLPTIYSFLGFYLKAANADVQVENCAKSLAVLSLLDHERLSFWPSTVAAGLVILASLAFDRESDCQRVMEAHVRTKSDDLPECIQSLEWLIKYLC